MMDGPRSSATQSSAHGEDDLTTGSILLVPRFGDQCRQRLIDNATWRIWDVGPVDCGTALARSAGAESASARADIIRDVFRKK